MSAPQHPPIGVSVSSDVEYRPGRPKPYKARARWVDPSTRQRRSKSGSHKTPEAAQAWIDDMVRAAHAGIDPNAATMRLAEYGDTVWTLATRGLELKTLEPYRAGWRKRVVPTLGHIPVRMVTNGVVDRAVHGWIADECSRSTVKNSLAILVRVMEQALRDGIVDRNPARVTGWQREYQRAEAARPSQDRRARVAHHHTAVSAPGPSGDRERGDRAQPAPERRAVPERSPPAGRLAGPQGQGECRFDTRLVPKWSPGTVWLDQLDSDTRH